MHINNQKLEILSLNEIKIVPKNIKLIKIKKTTAKKSQEELIIINHQKDLKSK